MHVFLRSKMLGTAAFAAGLVVCAGCTIETTSDQGDAGASTTSTGGATTGASNTTSSTGSTTGTDATTTTTGGDVDAGASDAISSDGTTGTGATGTTGTTGATSGTAGDDAAACLGDSLPEQTPPDCSKLHYAGTACPSQDDGGSDTLTSGEALCDYLSTRARPAVFAALYDCLNGAPALAAGCSQAQDDAVNKCLADTLAQACAAPDVTTDAGTTYGCADVSAACANDAGSAGADADTEAGAAGSSTVDQATCQKFANGLTDAARAELFSCFQTSAEPDCATRFSDCALNF